MYKYFIITQRNMIILIHFFDINSINVYNTHFELSLKWCVSKNIFFIYLNQIHSAFKFLGKQRDWWKEEKSIFAYHKRKYLHSRQRNLKKIHKSCVEVTWRRVRKKFPTPHICMSPSQQRLDNYPVIYEQCRNHKSVFLSETDTYKRNLKISNEYKPRDFYEPALTRIV